MKRLWIVLLCLGLLTACNPPSLDGTKPATPTEASGAREQPGVALLDQAKAVGESGNLQYIPNPHVESMACPEIRLYGNGLLLYEQTADGQLQIKRISLEDGCLLASATYPATPAVRVQVGNDMAAVIDSGNGQLRLLDGELKTLQLHALPREGESWCLSQDFENLFMFYKEKGLCARELATGKIRWLLEDASMVQAHDLRNDYVVFSYTDRAEQKTYSRCLNLSTAILETVPVESAVCSGVRSGEQWLLRPDASSGTYILVDEETTAEFTWTQGTVALLSGRRQLLATDGSYRNLCLYDLAGKFLSCCALEQNEHATVGDDLVWSGYWQGYFFRDTYDQAAHLMFWNIEVSQAGVDLAVAPLGTAQSGDPVMEKALYDRAQTLSRRFGLEICIAEQCGLDYSHYTAGVLLDPYFVRNALDKLEQALGAYPDGFFRQLPYGNLEKIRIELVGALLGKEGMDTHPASIGGFAQENRDHYLIVFDGMSLNAQSIYHEISHVIDKRLAWDAAQRPAALFSEDSWLALQPEGFRYAYSYTDIPATISAYENSGYFVSSYGLTFPTEDRATLISAVISDKSILQGKPGMAEKMRYYAACIRDCFNTDGWPESTLWELQNP